MKLKNKLLSLMSATAIVGSIAPLAIITSCSKNAEDINMVDITKGHVYTQEIYKGEEALNYHTATQAFIDAVKVNPNIFKDDMLSSYFRFYDEDAKNYINQRVVNENIDSSGSIDFTTTLQSVKVGISNPKFDMVRVDFPGEEGYPYPVISFKMKYSATFLSKSQTSAVQEKAITAETVYEGENTYTNIPFYAYLNSQNKGESNWSIGLSDLYTNSSYILNFLRGWELSTSYAVTTTTTTNMPNQKESVKKSVQSNSKKVSSFDEIKDKLSDFEIQNFAAFDFESSYLKNVKVAPEINAKKVKGVVIEREDDLPYVRVSGFYIPLYQELKDKINQKMYDEGQDPNKYIKFAIPEDVYFVSEDGKYSASAYNFVVEYNPFDEQGPSDVLALDLILTFDNPEDVPPQGQEISFVVPKSFNTTINMFFEEHEDPEESFETVVYPNRNLIDIVIPKHEDPTPGPEPAVSNLFGDYPVGDCELIRNSNTWNILNLSFYLPAVQECSIDNFVLYSAREVPDIVGTDYSVFITMSDSEITCPLATYGVPDIEPVSREDDESIMAGIYISIPLLDFTNGSWSINGPCYVHFSGIRFDYAYGSQYEYVYQDLTNKDEGFDFYCAGIEYEGYDVKE